MANAVELLHELVWYLDEPFADASAVPTYLVAKLARERGWEIEEFVRPVRMRDRLPVPSAATVAAATGAAVAAAATAALVAWRIGQRARPAASAAL